MARFILSYDAEIATAITERYVKQGFTTSFNRENPNGLRVVAFHKKNFKNQNVFECNEDFVVGIGTYLHFDCKQAEVLRWVYDHYNDATDIGTIQDEVVGHYVFIVHKAGKTVAFSDALGTFNFYHNAGNSGKAPFIASNNITAVADYTPSASLDIDGLFIEYAYGSLAHRTPVQDVARLMGSGHYVELGEKAVLQPINTQRFHIKRKNLEKLGADAIMNDMVERVSKVFDLLREFDEVGIFNTGGLDSRTVLSSALYRNLDPHLYYGIGNSPILNTQETDQRIVTQFSENIKLPLHLMQWTTSDKDCTLEAIDESVERYGAGGHEYGGGPGLHGSLESINSEGQRKIFLIGMGPAFANAEHFYKTYNTLDELSYDTVSFLAGAIWFKKPKRLMAEMRKEIAIFCEAHKLINAKEELQIDGDIVRTLLQVKPESENVNIFSDYDYYFVPYGCSHLLLPIMEVPLKLREKRWFQIELIKRLYPDLLDYPLFTGIKPLKIRKEQSEIEYLEEPGNRIHIRKNFWLDDWRHLYYTCRTRNKKRKYNDVAKVQFKILLPLFEQTLASKYWRKPHVYGVKGLRQMLVFSRLSEKNRTNT